MRWMSKAHLDVNVWLCLSSHLSVSTGLCFSELKPDRSSADNTSLSIWGAMKPVLTERTRSDDDDDVHWMRNQSPRKCEVMTPVWVQSELSVPGENISSQFQEKEVTQCDSAHLWLDLVNSWWLHGSGWTLGLMGTALEESQSHPIPLRTQMSCRARLFSSESSHTYTHQVTDKPVMSSPWSGSSVKHNSRYPEDHWEHLLLCSTRGETDSSCLGQLCL